MFKIVSARHVTPTQRKIIAYMIEQKCAAAHSKMINATMTLIEGNQYRVDFTKKERDDWGRPTTRRSNAIIEVVTE